MEKFYKNHLQGGLDVEGDDKLVEYHRHYALRCYLLFLVDTSMFMDKSSTYVDVVYLQLFIDLSAVHEYNWVASRLIYQYSKLGGVIFRRQNI